jgi:hypothetical protein
MFAGKNGFEIRSHPQHMFFCFCSLVWNMKKTYTEIILHENLHSKPVLNVGIFHDDKPAFSCRNGNITNDNGWGKR